MSIARTIAGFVIAPIVPGMLITGALLAAGAREEAQSVALANTYFGHPIALLIGAPIHVLLMRSRLTHWLAYAAAGAALGAFLYFAAPIAVDALLQLQGITGGHTEFTLSILPGAIVCAMVASSAFWLIVRPDRRATS